MAVFSNLTSKIRKAFSTSPSKNTPSELKKKKKTLPEKEQATIENFTKELGVQREGVIDTYDAEENPDDLGPETYVEMQKNDGEVQAIVRLLSLPIVSTNFHIMPGDNDDGERDFIEQVLTGPPSKGGMTTSLSFVIADMTRAIFEGFRLYEKVAQVIDDGPYEGKVSWRKLAPRDAQTVHLRADEHGGFDGAVQDARFEGKRYKSEIPPEKSVLFTFQKEKHWLYGQSILKTAHYHYDKKHKLYYIAHKKAEIESMGLKILRVNQNRSEREKTEAETAVDRIGVNSRITLPPGVELEIERGGDGYDPLPLIEHHNAQMAKSALTQVLDQAEYPYPYGSGTESSQHLVMALESTMSQMEETINQFVIAPLIDYNFNSNSYPELQFEGMSDATQVFLKDVFKQIMKTQVKVPQGFVQEVIDETARSLNLEWAYDQEVSERDASKPSEARKAFEAGKLDKSNELNMDAPKTADFLKDKLEQVPEDKYDACYKLGEKLAQEKYERSR